ncbi:MAG: TA system VapC family ribonuclease toxin [Acidobacteriota bacterium]
MIVPDANLLLYAYDADGPFHGAAARWWQSCLSGRQPVGLCAVVVFAFVRLATSQRVFARPLTIGEAQHHVQRWLERSVSVFLPAEAADLRRALAWLEAAGTGGNLTTDAQIAAIARRCRGVVHTADPDFGRFAGVRWLNPLRSQGATGER